MASIILQTSYLNHPDEKLRGNAVQELKKYLQEQDLDLKHNGLEKLLNRVNNIDCPEARLVISFYEELKNRPLKFEKELLGYIQQSRIKEKEFYETKWFYQKVSQFFENVDILIDCYAGNGLNGVIWALEGKADKVIFLDQAINPYFGELFNFSQTIADIDIKYKETNVINEGIPKGDLITSIHACGVLTDKLIEESIKQKSPFAVMPCCHSYSTHIEKEQLIYFENKTDAIDVARVMHIENNNYKVHLRNIDQKITDKNRIIIGIPKDY